MAEIKSLTAEQYHAPFSAFPFLGSTQIKAAKNLAKFKAQVLDASLPKESKRAWGLGSAAHSLNIEGDRSRYVVGPDVSKNSNAWKDFVRANEGKIILDEDQHRQLTGMARAFSEHSMCLQLVSESEIEKSILWTCEETGLDCKARPDGFFEEGRGIIAWDYKTAISASPEAFQKAIFEYGYDISAAHYSAGLKAATGKKVTEFRLIVQEKTAPYLIKVYSIAPRALERGFSQRLKLMNSIKVAFETNEWPGYGNAVEVIDLPEWAYMADNRQDWGLAL